MTTVLETTSRIGDPDANLPTRGVRTDDWLLPAIEPEAGDLNETTTDELRFQPSSGSPMTLPGGQRKVSEPIRKDHLEPRFPSDHIKLLQQWECVVSRVQDDCVECELHDLTDESKPVEVAEVYLEQFNHYDRPLLCEGAVFYWSIGYKTKKTGQIIGYWELRVRRMPQLSNLKKREISDRAKQLSELINNKP